MSRAPWLGGHRGDTVPFGSTLPRGNTDAAPAPTSAWLRGPGAATPFVEPAGSPALPACTGCAETARLRLEVERLSADGAAAGRAEGLAETARARAQLAAAATAVRRHRALRDDALTELVVDVALGLCAELAPAASAIDRRGLVQLVSKALGDAGVTSSGSATAATRDLVLRMCADDVAAVGSQLPSGVTCEIGADLAHGEVFVEAPRLVVDGRWAPRLAALREPLLALVRAAEPAFELATDGGAADDDDPLIGDDEDDHGA